MQDFVVHGIPGSPFVRAVLLTLDEKGAPYRFARMAMGEHKAPAHLARHPWGRIPVLEHGDFRLYETQAILRYLDAVLPEPRMRPAEPRDAARVDQLMNIVDWYLFQQVLAKIVFQRVLVPMHGGTPDEAVITAAMPAARLCVATLADLLGPKTWFVGDAPSLADMMLGPTLAALAATPEGAELMVGTPLLVFLDRMNARASMQRTTREYLLAA
jgi:glutathione S-transferase